MCVYVGQYKGKGRNMLTSEMMQCHAHQVPLAPWLVVVDVHFAKELSVVDVLGTWQAGDSQNDAEVLPDTTEGGVVAWPESGRGTAAMRGRQKICLSWLNATYVHTYM